MSYGIKGPWTEQEEYFKEQLLEMVKRPENKECADCTAKNPKWAAYNWGIFICHNCSGKHRNLGTGVSKVRSINLDRWRPEQFECMKGNAKANSELLYNFPNGSKKPNETDEIAITKFITQKYVERKWLRRKNQKSVELTDSIYSTSLDESKTYSDVKSMSMSLRNSQMPPKFNIPQLPQQKTNYIRLQQPINDLLDIINEAPQNFIYRPQKNLVVADQYLQQQEHSGYLTPQGQQSQCYSWKRM